MSVKNFIPALWNADIKMGLEKAQVAAGVCNREYEGEIAAFGDTVKVNQIGNVTVNTYAGTTITYQEMDDAQRELKIDQKKYFAFKLDDVDAAQAKGGLLDAYGRRAVYNLSDTVDTAILALYAQAGLAVGTNTTPIDVTSLNVEEYLLTVGETMNDAGVPEGGRFMIIPPWFRTKMTLAGISTLSDNMALYARGYMGSAFGFDFLMSQNVSKNSSSWDKTRIMCGIRGESFALAQQLVKTEALRLEDTFHDAVRGLLVYGLKIMRPDMTLTFYADKTAES